MHTFADPPLTSFRGQNLLLYLKFCLNSNEFLLKTGFQLHLGAFLLQSKIKIILLMSNIIYIVLWTVLVQCKNSNATWSLNRIILKFLLKVIPPSLSNVVIDIC